MIQSIHIKNFQSHQNTRLEFHPGLNAILGVSDSGKSAILRALHWTRENRPMGDAHISKWAKSDKGKLIAECSVDVMTQGGLVSRIRSPEFNGYKIGELSFEAVRSDVPVEIVEAFNMGEVNVQKQLDAPFLLSKSAAEVSRFFNAVVNLEEMGQLMCAAEQERLSLKKELKKSEKDSEALGTKIDALSWIDQAKALVEQAESLEHSRDALISKRTRLLKLRDDAGAHMETIKRCAPIIDLAMLIDKGKRLSTNLTTIASKKSALVLLQSQVLRNKTIIADGLSVVTIGEKVMQAKELSARCGLLLQSKTRLCALHSEARTSASLVKTLSAIAQRGEQEQRAKALVASLAKLAQDNQALTLIKAKLQMYARTVSEKAAEIAELEANLPTTCPTCGQLVIHKH